MITIEWTKTITKILNGEAISFCNPDLCCLKKWLSKEQGSSENLYKLLQLQILVPPLGCVTMKKLLNLSDHQLHYLKSGDNITN